MFINLFIKEIILFAFFQWINLGKLHFDWSLQLIILESFSLLLYQELIHNCIWFYQHGYILSESPIN